MKKIILGFAMIVGLSQAVFSQLQVGLILQGSSTPVLCEPIPVQIYWENKGAKPIKVGPPVDPKFSRALSLWVDGRKAMSFPPPDAPSMLISPSAPSELKPGERIEKPYDLRVLKLRPGAHQVKLVADFVGFPEGYYQGRVESGTLEITIQTPQGVDLQAYEYAEGMVDRGETNTPYMSHDEAICVPLATADILTKYPSSVYAAWAAHRKYFGPTEQVIADKRWRDPKNPERLFLWVFPPKEDTKNLLEVVEATLKHHPDFALLTDMKYAEVDLLLQLDRRKEAVQRLEIYSKDDDKETASWAKKYLDAYKILVKEKRLKN